MNLKYKTASMLAILALAPSMGLAARNKPVTINLAVKTLQGAAVQDAQVRANFRYATAKPYGRHDRWVEGLTDPRGQWTATSETYGRMICKVENPGSYESTVNIAARSGSVTEQVILRPIKAPVPLIARKDIRKLVPEKGLELGFDLVKADWMPPHGKGEIQDVIIKADGKQGELSFWSTLQVKFDGAFNGIKAMPNRYEKAKSALRSDYLAPRAGYRATAEFESTEGVKAKTRYKYSDVHYIRIRSGKSGGSKALYGKVYGNMVQMTEKGPVLVLSYLFINPTPGSRNVEFDPTHNLAADYNPEISARSLKVEIP